MIIKEVIQKNLENNATEDEQQICKGAPNCPVLSYDEIKEIQDSYLENSDDLESDLSFYQLLKDISSGSVLTTPRAKQFVETIPLYKKMTEDPVIGNVVPKIRLASPNAEVSILVPGDHRVGVVLYIAQNHDKVDLQYQYEILKLLIKLGYKHVFSEGAMKEQPPELVSQNLPAEVRAQFAALFSETNLLEQPNPVQMNILLKAKQAGAVYCVMKEGVFIHTPESYEVRTKMAEVEKTDWDQFLKLAYLTREDVATSKIMNFLKAHPGETAILIFGAGHDFQDNFANSEKKPIVIEISFPILIKKSTGKNLQELRKDIRRLFHVDR